MAFKVPTFPLTCNVWHGLGAIAVYPPTAPPDLQVRCQLRLYRTAFLASTGGSATSQMLLLLPARTDIRQAGAGPAATDLVEVPAGSLRFYVVAQVDDVAKGFANEFRVAGISANKQRAGGWPTPYP